MICESEPYRIVELAQQELDDLLVCVDPPLGSWNEATSFRSPEPARVLLLTRVRNWGGSEKAGQIRVFVGESSLAASLHLALDLALHLVIATRDLHPTFARPLRAISGARRYVIGAAAPTETFEALPSFAAWWQTKESAATAAAESLYAANRATFRAIEAVALFAALQVDRLDDFRSLEANVPEPFHISLVGEGGKKADLIGDLIERIGQIGRRATDHRMDEIMALRAVWEAAPLLDIRESQYRVPTCLMQGVEEALSYCRSNGLAPVTRADGAGHFRFPLLSLCRSKHGEERRIHAYALSAVGEPVYIVRTKAGYSAKRVWKANLEYALLSEYRVPWDIKVGPMRVSQSSVNWRDVPFERFIPTS